jgi:hypothetical protein
VLGVTLGALGAGAAGAQAPTVGTLRITLPAVQGATAVAAEPTPPLTGLKVRAARATRADYGPFALASRRSEDIDLPAGSYVVFGARLRKAACPDTPVEIKGGRRVTLVFESAAPGGGAPVCAVRVSAGP